MSSESITAPADSKVVAGTQLGAPKLNLNGVFLPFSIINSTPFTPKTFAISCGSLTVAIVPCLTAILANSDGTNIELSIWMCASTKPGNM